LEEEVAMTASERNRQMRELVKQIEELANVKVDPEREDAFYERIADTSYNIWEKNDIGLHEKTGCAYSVRVAKRMAVSKELLEVSKEVMGILKRCGWLPEFVERYRVLISKAE